MTTKAADVRAQLGHPIIDADGHFVELSPLVDDVLATSLEEAGGPALRDRYLAGTTTPFDTSSVLADRASDSVRRQWRAMPSWWGWQTANVRDRATAHLPRLLYERLDEIGIDFTILYPSTVLGLLDLDDPEVACAAAKGVNRWLAATFAPYADRMTVGGIVPMNTPDVAIEVVDAAVAAGIKSVVISGYAKRYLADPPADGGHRPYWLDHYGVDSHFDYDLFWARCIELGVAPVSHSAHQNHRVSRSISNYAFNHIGGLATSHESLAKSLFMSGVTARFPSLRVGFLEGGVAWACSLFADLIGHWQKRNGDAIVDLDPDRLDVQALMKYIDEYGTDEVLARADRLREYFSRPAARPAQLDEFAAADLSSAADIARRFVPNFYFGCEADDPLVAWAFAEHVNPQGARLRPIFGSDISHWDVPDMTEPVEEAYGLVEKGVVTHRDFRELMFVNPVRLHAGMNPRFFDGTVVESAVAGLVAEGLD